MIQKIIKDINLREYLPWPLWWHTIKPEHCNTDSTRNTRRTTEQRRNNGTPPEYGITERRTPVEQPEHHRTMAEYRNNETPQKLEPEDKDCIFHYLQFSLECKVMRAINI